MGSCVNERRCKSCVWWDSAHPRVLTLPPIAGIQDPGICRRDRPDAVAVNASATVFIGMQPIMDAEDFCGEHNR